MNCVENLEGEIWRYVMSEEIGFYPYMVSNMGRVKSLNYKQTGDEKLLKANKTKQGYLQVFLYCKGEKKHFFVHRLVALMFLKPDPNLDPNDLEVNHIDEDKTNNCVENLEWCTHRYNINYGTCTERMKETIKTSVARAEGNAKKMKKVYQYNQNLELVNTYSSSICASKQTGYSRGNICECCNGRQKTAYGYVWSYVELSSKEVLDLFERKNKSKQVFQYSTDLVLINVFPSLKNASLETGFSAGWISQSCNGKQKTAYNYIWSYSPIETEKKIS